MIYHSAECANTLQVFYIFYILHIFTIRSPVLICLAMISTKQSIGCRVVKSGSNYGELNFQTSRGMKNIGGVEKYKSMVLKK